MTGNRKTNIRFLQQADSYILSLIVGIILLSSISFTNSGFAQSPTCSDGSQPDDKGNCGPTTIIRPHTSEQASPQSRESPIQTPSSGPESVESGPQGCPPGYHKDPIESVCLRDTTPQPQPTPSPTLCSDGSQPDDKGNCPTPTPTPSPTLCSDGSQPDDKGNCPTPTPTPSPTLCSDGSQPEDKGN